MYLDKEKPGCLAQFLTIVTAMGLIICTVSYCSYQKSKETPEDRKAANCGRSGIIPAHTMAKHYVEGRLKAPSTAKFPWYDDSQVWPVGECEFVVKSYVDAENSFGAMLRNDYYVRLRYDPVRDAYTLLDIRVGK